MGTSAALGTDAAANEASAQLAKLIEEQEEREAQARRRVPINPPQPAPSAHAERELYRRGWEPR